MAMLEKRLEKVDAGLPVGFNQYCAPKRETFLPEDETRSLRYSRDASRYRPGYQPGSGALLYLGLYQCLSILDALYAAKLINDHPGEFKEATRFAYGYYVPAPENRVNLYDAISDANLGQGTGLKSRDQLDEDIALNHLAAVYS